MDISKNHQQPTHPIVAHLTALLANAASAAVIQTTVAECLATENPEYRPQLVLSPTGWDIMPRYEGTPRNGASINLRGLDALADFDQDCDFDQDYVAAQWSEIMDEIMFRVQISVGAYEE